METIDLTIPWPFLPPNYIHEVDTIITKLARNFGYDDIKKTRVTSIANILFIVYDHLYNGNVIEIDYDTLKSICRRNKDLMIHLFSNMYPFESDFKLTYWISLDTGIVFTPSDIVRVNRHNKHH